MRLSLFPERYGIARLAPDRAVPARVWQSRFLSITRTGTELSLVCEAHLLDEQAPARTGWRCLEVQGPLDFSLVGVLWSLTDPLARVGVSVFAVSTYDTDYLLVQEAQVDQAVAALREAGHAVEPEEGWMP